MKKETVVAQRDMHGGGAKGFTLIEMMITVAVIAILAAVAYPSYRDSVAKGRRADAKAQLLAAQQWMERVYSETYTYQSVGGTAIGTVLATQPFKQSPADGAAAYTISVNAPDANSYVLKATRTGVAAGDACGDFTLSSAGAKSVAAGTFDSGKYATAAAAALACWR
jgi:type IV pilus assembly protein PilE